MIGSRHNEAVRALQADAAHHGAQLTALSPQVDALVVQLATLTSQVATLSAQATALALQVAAEQERSASEATRTAQLECRVAEMEQVTAEQAEILRLVQEAGERQVEAAAQTRGAMARLERQAAIDLDEMRRTGNALTRGILFRHVDAVAPGDDPNNR